MAKSQINSKFHAPKADDIRGGFTLIELLVAIGLFSIVVTIATAGFVNALKTQRQVASLISADSNVSLVLEQMAREERTGYLFCHAITSTAPNNVAGSDDYCGCTIQASGAWSCNALDYYTAQGDHVNYSLAAGALVRTDSKESGGAPVSITGNDVSVKYLNFTLFGNLEGDHWTPRITIAIGIVPSSSDPGVSGDVLQFQTTVSAREIDCPVISGGSC